VNVGLKVRSFGSEHCEHADIGMMFPRVEDRKEYECEETFTTLTITNKSEMYYGA